MKIADVRAKTDDELKDQLALLSKEKFNLRFQRASGQLENTARAKTVRHSIARIETVIGERRRGVKIEPKAKPAKAAKAPAKAKKTKKAE